MPKFAANLTMLFTELPFMERFEAACKVGFKGVEILFPYVFDAKEIADKLKTYNLQQVLFNMPPGEWDAGERGLASIPGREDEFKVNVDTALYYAKELRCKRIHAMSGIVAQGESFEKHMETFINNIRYAADAFNQEGITLLIEPLNSRDMPGYFVSHQRDAVALIKQVDKQNVKLQFDFYHAQIMDGDLTTLIRDLHLEIGHMQIASVPDRNEPSDGEVNYTYIFRMLDEIGYQGWIGCEYTPKNATVEGLDWAKPFL